MTGRNDPCWCGSGKKYKKCHLQQDLEKDSSGTSDNFVQTRANPRIKSADELQKMRRAGQVNGELHEYIRPHIKAGITTEEIDQLVHQWTVERGYTPATLGYHGYTKSCCISINNVVCHGIPSQRETLRDGDIVNIDLTTIVDGYYGDSSETYCIGEVTHEARQLVDVTARAMLLGIKAVAPGKSMRVVAEAIEPFVREHGFSVVRQYTGHGIGKKFHEFFSVYHHIDEEMEKIRLEPGMTFTIEPMINAGDYRVVTDRRDKWTVRTKDDMLSAQFEHTIAVTDTGSEILTLTPRQREQGYSLIVDGVDCYT